MSPQEPLDSQGQGKCSCAQHDRKKQERHLFIHAAAWLPHAGNACRQVGCTQPGWAAKEEGTDTPKDQRVTLLSVQTESS